MAVIRASGDTLHPGLLRPGVLAFLGLAMGHVASRGLELTSFLPGLAAVLVAIAGLWFFRAREAGWVLALWLLFAGGAAIQGAQLQRADREARGAAANLFDGGTPLAVARGPLGDFPRRIRNGWMCVLAPGNVVETRGRTVRIPVETALIVRAADSGIPDPLASAVPGDRLVAIGALLELPGDDSLGEAGHWFRPQGAVVYLRASAPITVQPADGRSAWTWFLRLSRSAGARAETMMKAALPPREAALLTSMTLGRTDSLSDDQRAAFRRAGLMHLFSVSGLHVVFVGSLALFLFRLMPLGTLARLLLFAGFLLFFAALVGMRNSVLRAATLLLAFELQHIMRRPVEPLAALGTVASVLLLLSPRVLWQIDFQMSFLCAATIMLASGWMIALQQSMGHRLGWGIASTITIRATQIILLSALIQLALLPVLLRVFHEVSLTAPMANVVALPLSSILLPATFAALIVGWISAPIGVFLLGCLEIPVMVLDRYGGFWGGGNWAVHSGMAMPLWATACLYALLLGGSWSLHRAETHPRRPLVVFAPGAFALAALFIWLPLAKRGGSSLDLWFIDVGQGDATLLRAPGGTTMLVDAGPDSAAWLLPSKIRSLGIDRIDYLVATHADSDHIGGMAELIHAMPVGAFVFSGGTADTTEFAEVADAVGDEEIGVYTIARGGRFRMGDSGVEVEVLHPHEPFLAETIERNAASIVLKVRWRGRTILLTGDAEETAEADMLAADLDLRADVLKAGHHGSGGSTGAAFLDAVRPRHIIISCGRNNRYNHPSPELLGRLAERGITNIRRTDEDGTIHLQITGGGAMRWAASRRQATRP